MAGAAHAGPTDQLKELRGRIDSLQKQLTESEESKSEAADALRETERAISDANRRLFELAGQQRDVKSTLARLEAQKSRLLDGTEAQQALLAKLLYHQYLSGQPDPLRLIFNRQDPNEIARQMHYLSSFRAPARGDQPFAVIRRTGQLRRNSGQESGTGAAAGRRGQPKSRSRRSGVSTPPSSREYRKNSRSAKRSATSNATKSAWRSWSIAWLGSWRAHPLARGVRATSNCRNRCRPAPAHFRS
jgi:hypothetical protein